MDLTFTQNPVGNENEDSEETLQRGENILEQVEEDFLSGKLNAFGRDQNSLLKQLDSLRQSQVQLCIDHINAETKKTDSENATTGTFEAVVHNFDSRESATTQLLTKLESLAQNLDVTGTQVCNSMHRKNAL